MNKEAQDLILQNTPADGAAEFVKAWREKLKNAKALFEMGKSPTVWFQSIVTGFLKALSLLTTLRTQLASAQGEVERLRKMNELLEGDLVIMQSEFVADTCTCTEKDGSKILDSCAVSSRADAMRFLAERGKIVIEKEYGRRVIGKWAESPQIQKQLNDSGHGGVE